MTEPSAVERWLADRLAEEEAAAVSMPEPARHRRIVTVLRQYCVHIAAQLEASQVTGVDNPIGAAFMLVAPIWEDHPEYAPSDWFPRMLSLPGPGSSAT
ncbi:MAG: hypothetical protein QM662_14130 [Gordonia sp. (in: high G+C Gram-positive bacteria)]